MTISPTQQGWPHDLVILVRQAGTLCLNVADPGWDDARGYLFEEAAAALYFPVAKKHLTGDLACFRVLIWSQPRVLITGELRPATSDQDATTQFRLAEEAGMPPDTARHLLLDQRSGKPRKTRYKLLIREMSRLPN